MEIIIFGREKNIIIEYLKKINKKYKFFFYYKWK